ncbi:MAG: hypothetical protein ABH883_03665, partial [Candidatus Omnitrophota bacterium]
DEKEYLLDVFAELLYESEGIFHQYFTNSINFFLEKRSRKDFIPLLVAVAKGNNTIKSIQESLGKTDNSLGKKLETLQSMDLIYNSGVFFKISDRFFEYWLKYVYSLKTESMIDDMDIRYIEFKRSIEEDYSRFRVFSAKSIEEIIKGFFAAFRNQKIRVSMNDRRMPHFDDVRSRKISDNVIEVTGTIKNNKWLCRVKSNDITEENDIHALAGCKMDKKNSKIVRKIFIPLKSIEQNAFLLAQEQNIWIWEITQLNEILRLFEEFEIVL